MILGVGVHVVRTARIARAFGTDGQSFEDRVYTAAERAACAQRADRAQALAARFAAKEALRRALGAGAVRRVSLQQVEVVGTLGGGPALKLVGAARKYAHRRRVRRIYVTLTHEPRLAAAVVLLEG
jgi:holo-[acyl-carrier protein] synthase